MSDLEITQEERRSVLSLYLGGRINKSDIAKQVFGVYPGGSLNWQTAKAKIEKIIADAQISP